MVRFKNVFIICAAVFFTQQLFSQQLSTGELFELYEKADGKEKRIEFTKAFLKQSKKENNKKRIVTGYYLLAYENKNELRLSYLDSIIELTKNKPIGHHPAIAFNEKAKHLQKKGQFKRAIDNYILSNKFAVFSNDKYLTFNNNFNIGTIKRFIGEYQESINLFRKCLSFIAKEINNPQFHNSYLKTITSLSNGYYELKKIDSAAYYNNLGVHKSIEYGNKEVFHHLCLNQGIVEFLKGNDEAALDSINKHKLYFFKKNDSVNLSYIYFYLAKINSNKGLTKKAVSNYKKIDSLLSFKEDLTPKFRSSYIFLINYFKKERDLKKQLFYVNKLVFFDSIINSKTNYLSKTIFKEYDIPNLKLEKEKIKKELDQKSISFRNQIFFILFLLLLTIIFLIYQYQKRKIYKQNFLNIINEVNKKEVQPQIVKYNKNEELDIPQDIIKTILRKLEVFEKEKKYLRKNLTLNTLAKELDTNTAYLSKIINHYKKEKFSTYLNNLKIEHIILEIKTNPILRKFTIKAIADEAYFNNPDSFSKAFYKLKGIKPSYFFKEINNLDKIN